MKKDNLVYLEDIMSSCEKIIAYTGNIEKADFDEDTLTQDAIIRNITIIGEAASKLTKDFMDSNPEFPARDAITMRNKLVHDYSFVDSDILWDTITKDIPNLAKLTKKIIQGHK
jgi:uncharacterized protein with HEPN domain